MVNNTEMLLLKKNKMKYNIYTLLQSALANQSTQSTYIKKKTSSIFDVCLL